jgi:hypothetical protein
MAVAIFTNIRVCFIVWMSLGTVSSCPMFCARSLSGHTSLHIYLMSNQLQVARVNTARVSTKMVGFKTILNWSYESLIGKAMSEHRPSTSIGLAPYLETAIAEFILSGCPFPAGRTIPQWAILVDFAPEALTYHLLAPFLSIRSASFVPHIRAITFGSAGT